MSDTKEATLKPCPFCGGESRMDWGEESGDFWRICNSCAATGPWTKSRDAADGAWNRRILTNAGSPNPPRVTTGEIVKAMYAGTTRTDSYDDYNPRPMADLLRSRDVVVDEKEPK